MISLSSSYKCSTTENSSVNNLETSLHCVDLADISYCTVSDIYHLDGNLTLYRASCSDELKSNERL